MVSRIAESDRLGSPDSLATWLARGVQLLMIYNAHLFVGAVIVIAQRWATIDLRIEPVGEPLFESLDRIASVQLPLPHARALTAMQSMGLLALLAACEGLLGYLPYRAVADRAERSVWAFVRRWAQVCAAGLVLVPAAAAALAVLPGVITERAAPILLLSYFLLGPAVAAELSHAGRPRRRPRRCVCPECGVPHRGSPSQCASCGTAVPVRAGPHAVWTVRRLAWERSSVRHLPAAYLTTVLGVLLRPVDAARRVAIPDRLGRAVGWAAAHLLLLALVGVAFGSDRYYIRRLMAPAWDTTPIIFRSWTASPPLERVAGWALQSLAAWLIAGAGLPLLGGALSTLVPPRHTGATRTLLKWSLYCTAVISVPVVLFFCGHCAWWLLTLASGWGTPPESAGWLPWQPWPPPLTLLAIPYAIWWAVGVALNPRARYRGFLIGVLAAAGYLVVWSVLVTALFPPGSLVSLL